MMDEEALPGILHGCWAGMGDLAFESDVQHIDVSCEG